MKLPVYMDYQATTPVDPRVLDAMLPYFTEKFGNPASKNHQFGWIAEEAVEKARSTIAKVLGVDSGEIIFTSGATESNNLVIKGLSESLRSKGNHIISAVTEHKSVIDSCKRIHKNGADITFLQVDKNGSIDPDQLRKALTPKTILVTLMSANNEIGTLLNLTDIGNICREHNILFHTDAAQAIGKVFIDIGSMPIDYLSISGHKIYGPKGIGALFMRNKQSKVKLTPQINGGAHEKGIRAGTINVPGVVGLAKTIEIAGQEMATESIRISAYRDKMWKEFSSQLPDVYLNGHSANRLPNNLNVSFLNVEDSALMMSISDIAVSTGSACSTLDPAPSHVLKALNLPHNRIHSAIRFGLGRYTTNEEVEYVINRVIESVNKLRKQSKYSAKSEKIQINLKQSG
jgi:cysteine desulfurase